MKVAPQWFRRWRVKQHSSQEPPVNGAKRIFHIRLYDDKSSAEVSLDPAALLTQVQAAGDPAERIALYVGLVKNSALTAEDAMIIPYLLYGSADERKYLAALMMRKCGAKRVKAYNFAVARDREPGFLTSYGDRLPTSPKVRGAQCPHSQAAFRTVHH